MLNTAQLQTDIENAMLANLPNPSAQQQAEITLFALNMATALTAFVKGAQVVYTAGLVAPSGGGPVTGVITHTIQ